ncbi:MAG: MEMO1 family protein, partial [Planctomycetota bacterium]|nr:MEMO1 family protein [Planctomycetota bacterium]
VLAGSLADFIAAADRPSAAAEPQISAFIQALRRLAAEMPGRTLFIASADLAHIGRRFGDDRDIDNTFLAEAEEADRQYLAAAARGDAAAALASLQRHGDRYHVCGSAAIFVLNAVLAGARG